MGNQAKNDKPWDNAMSLLVMADSQAFLDLLFPGTYYNHRTKLKNTQRQPDAVLEAIRHDQRFIANIEFQAVGDIEMAQWLLLYAILIWWQHKLNISSFVIYLFQDNRNIAFPPFSMRTPGKEPGDLEERIRFHYTSLKMWDLQPEDILRLGRPALYPFLPLTRGGATRAMADQMFALLTAEEHHDFALVGFSLASGIFSKLKQFDDLTWLERKHQHMHDIIRDTPFYSWITADAREQALAEGRAEGRAETLTILRNIILDTVQKRFPTLTNLAEANIKKIDIPSQLEQLFFNLNNANDVEQARQVLLSSE